MKVLQVTYSQTPESVVQAVATARNDTARVDPVSEVFPWAPLVAGVAAILIGLFLGAASSTPASGPKRHSRRPRGYQADALGVIKGIAQTPDSTFRPIAADFSQGSQAPSSDERREGSQVNE